MLITIKTTQKFDVQFTGPWGRPLYGFVACINHDSIVRRPSSTTTPKYEDGEEEDGKEIMAFRVACTD